MGKKRLKLTNIALLIILISVFCILIIFIPPNDAFSSKSVNVLHINEYLNDETIIIDDKVKVDAILSNLESKNYKLTGIDTRSNQFRYTIKFYQGADLLKNDIVILDSNFIQLGLLQYSFEDKDISFLSDLFK